MLTPSHYLYGKPVERVEAIVKNTRYRELTEEELTARALAIARNHITPTEDEGVAH